VVSDNWRLTSLKLELAYFSGRAWWGGRENGGAGVILRFERVRPRRRASFQPLRGNEVTPGFLDRAIGALKRWKYDIIDMDEVCHRAVTMAGPRRFVCLTFDGASKDLITFAYPVLRQHRVPFTVYVPTAFPDGIGEAWWLALEDIIARETRMSLMIDRKERHLEIGARGQKYEAYAYVASWMRSLAPADLKPAIDDLCRRYSVDLARLSREASMDWTDLAMLAADPNVTLGGATVNYPMLANVKDADAYREMTMGRAVAETALQRPIAHFAYPFGDRAAWRRAHVAMAEEAGFRSAVSAVPGFLEAESRSNLHALPRIAWDGRQRSLRVLRVLLSGVASGPVRPTRNEPVA
jgi:peptidoglycan/xylan/chitin deacetylase (PgdA/CDA1 family)